jgi:hypothetical protein
MKWHNKIRRVQWENPLKERTKGKVRGLMKGTKRKEDKKLENKNTSP